MAAWVPTIYATAGFVTFCVLLAISERDQKETILAKVEEALNRGDSSPQVLGALERALKEPLNWINTLAILLLGLPTCILAWPLVIVGAYLYFNPKTTPPRTLNLDDIPKIAREAREKTGGKKHEEEN